MSTKRLPDADAPRSAVAAVARTRSRGLVVPVVALLAAVAIGVLKLPYGMFWPDEGFYLSSSRRLLLGDVPFRDEVSYATSWFFVVLTPVLALLPDGGTVLQVRGIGFALRVLSAGALFLSFRRSLTPGLIAGGLAVCVLANYPSLMVPSYNSLPFDLGFLSLACWTLGLRARATVRAAAWGALGGVLFAGSCLCYLPRFALVVIPVGVLAWARGRRDSSLAASTAALLGAMALVAAVSCAWLAARGLVGELLEAIRFQAQSPALAPPLGQRLLGLLQTERARALPSTATHLLFAAAALVAATRSSARAWVGLLAVAYAVVVTGVYVRHGDKSVPAYALVYTGLCWLPLVVYPFLRRRLGALHPDVAGAAAVLFLMGAGQQAVAALTSTQAAAAGIPGLAASLLLLLLLGEAAAPEPRRRARLAGSAFCLCLAANGAVFHFYAEQNPLRVATSAFASGRLRGLRSSERFVTGWSRIDEGLRPRLQRGEFLLAYENIPLLYYLTDTRPALRATYVSSFIYAPPQQQELLDEMVRKGRIPRYAVRLMEGRADEYGSPSYSPRPQEDPINAFVLEHYRLEVLLPPFEVFRHR